MRSILLYKNIMAFPACTIENGCSDLPIIDCKNINMIFYFIEKNDTKLYKEDNCIVLEGSKQEQIRLVNRIAYTLFGVM